MKDKIKKILKITWICLSVACVSFTLYYWTIDIFVCHSPEAIEMGRKVRDMPLSE